MAAGRRRMFAAGAICNSSIYRVDEVPPLPSKVLASEMCQVVDGMALSAAYAFVRLGGSAQICARVGDDDLGVSMRRTLAAEGLDTSGLHSVPGTVTSQATVIVDRRGDRLELVHPAGNAEVTLTRLEKADGTAIDVAPGNGHRVWAPLPATAVGAFVARFV